MSIYATIFDCDTAFAYDGSHVLPDRKHPSTASVDLASVPGFVERDGVEQPANEAPYPFLRVGVDHSCAVLDYDDVIDMHRALGLWIKTAKRGL